ncbi:MAG: MFS transporter [Ottowia sp.]|nr:MFS transporter [Ottowia sp.]
MTERPTISTPPSTPPAAPALGDALLALFALAAGLAIGNLYWAQPLLAHMAADFGLPAERAGWLIGATQGGYALGVLLLVPLGDVARRRRLICTLMLAASLALAACALAGSFRQLALALGCVGLLTVSGQIIVPLAGELAGSARRGRAVGAVTSGITAGILLVRLAGGAVAAAWGGRGVYVLAAALHALLAALLWRALPALPAPARQPWLRLLGDVASAPLRYRALPAILLVSGLVFGVAFNLFWTARSFLLAAPPFGYNTFQIGLMSLAGVTGALAGVGLGRLQDAGLGRPALGAFIALCAASVGAAALAARSAAGVAVCAAVQALAVQGVNILNQTRVVELSDTERSRLNTAFVVSNFCFAAAGSALAAVLWRAGGWTAISGAAAAACLLALAVWRLSR